MDSLKTVVVFHNPEKSAAKKELPRIKSWLKKRGIRVCGPEQSKQAQVAVALGGDGTLLAAARQLAPLGIPVLGINLGHLGFMTTSDIRKAYEVLGHMLSGKLTISERMMLWAKSPRSREQLALNDCVIRSSSSVRVIRLSAWVDGEYLATFVSDGLILSTPTGSTAYSLAALGPISEPEMDLMLLTPICSHSLTQRPVILSPKSVVEIRLENTSERDRVVMSLDGQKNVTLKPGDRVTIRKASIRFRIYKNPKESYFSILRQKLNWGK